MVYCMKPLQKRIKTNICFERMTKNFPDLPDENTELLKQLLVNIVILVIKNTKINLAD